MAENGIIIEMINEMIIGRIMELGTVLKKYGKE